MTKLPDTVINVLCEDILPTLRKTGSYDFEAHLDKLDRELSAAVTHKDLAPAILEIVNRKINLLMAWQWITAQA